MIQIADNMFTENEIIRFEDEVKNLPYNINTTDDDEDSSSGAAAPMNMNSITHELLLIKIYEKWPELQELELYDCHTNCFWPGEFTQFHTDNPHVGAMTVLYYCNENKWKDGGTEVLFEDEMRVESILPVSGRLMKMPGNQLHRATSFRDKKRLNVAYKFRPCND